MAKKKKKRDYKRERELAIKRGETGVGSNSGDARRHRARAAYEKKHGDLPSHIEVDHKKPIKSGGGDNVSNLRTKDRSSNRSHGGKIGNRKGKAAGGKK